MARRGGACRAPNRLSGHVRPASLRPSGRRAGTIARDAEPPPLLHAESTTVRSMRIAMLFPHPVPPPSASATRPVCNPHAIFAQRSSIAGRPASAETTPKSPFAAHLLPPPPALDISPNHADTSSCNVATNPTGTPRRTAWHCTQIASRTAKLCPSPPACAAAIALSESSTPFTVHYSPFTFHLSPSTFHLGQLSCYYMTHSHFGKIVTLFPFPLLIIKSPLHFMFSEATQCRLLYYSDFAQQTPRVNYPLVQYGPSRRQPYK